MDNVLTLILAGGKGTRLEPLTRDRAKPAVPFGGLYRIIDFTLSNCINSGLRRVLVVTQFKARSLDLHLRQGWNILSPELHEFIDVLPPQQRLGEQWYAGTADAIYQNIYTIESEKPQYILILAGDHIYKMDYREMLKQHIDEKSDLTIGCIPVPLEESRHFGVVETDAANNVTDFIEKPATAKAMPGETKHFLASMGIYVFNAKEMYELLIADAGNPDSQHDFGRNIIPAMIQGAIGKRIFKILAHRFKDMNDKPMPYWRDVGTLDAYYQANMDLVSVEPALNLYDARWPIRTLQPQMPPPKFVFYADGPIGRVRRGEAHESIVCNGCIVSGGRVWHSILAPNVRVNSYAQIEESMLFDNVNVGRYCRIRRAIIDKDVKIPEGMEIGFNPDVDRALGLTISDNGIVVVPKSHTFVK